jgi:hypothetical protein
VSEGGKCSFSSIIHRQYLLNIIVSYFHRLFALMGMDDNGGGRDVCACVDNDTIASISLAHVERFVGD